MINIAMVKGVSFFVYIVVIETFKAAYRWIWR